MEIFLIILGIVFVLIIFVASVYNNLVSLKLRAENAWAQIDTQLKRRFDLIPNLVETVKGYAKHESTTLEKVIEARSKYAAANGSVEKTAEAEGMLQGAVKQLFALAEDYPELKANENFKALQIELSGTEDKIAYARQFYNDTVQKYNEKIMVFPNNIVVPMFGANKFGAKEFFEVEDDSERESVKVEF